MSRAVAFSQKSSGDFMWEININQQILSFLYALAFGGLFSFLYDIFKALRLAHRFSSIAIFFQDIIYFIIISLISFCLFLALSNGEIRSYILFGFLIGAIIWRITLSKFFVNIFKYFFLFNKKIFKIISSVFLRLEVNFEKILKKFEKIFKKHENKVKNS